MIEPTTTKKRGQRKDFEREKKTREVFLCSINHKHISVDPVPPPCQSSSFPRSTGNSISSGCSSVILIIWSFPAL